MTATDAGVREEADVVVVGARVAGAAAATELARRGRRVIAIDAATFPSDTLSTHAFFPGCVAEIKALGALEAIQANGAPRYPYVTLVHGGYEARGTWTAVDGIDYGLCPRRTTLDHALVEAARRAGAEVREATRLVELVWSRGRVTGVRWSDRDGRRGEIACRLVVGADGRRSTVATQVGASTPYRRDENERGLVFMYVDDPAGPDSPERHTLSQWRVGDTLGFYVPTCDGAGMALLMGPKEDVANYGQDLRHWNEIVGRNRRFADRIGGGAPRSKLRKATDTFSYIRRSSGPGWALTGDAGHFKDPVIAQGIRDAIYHSRRLGMSVAEVLDDPSWLDRRVYEWELARDRDCLSSYYVGLRMTKTHPVSPFELEVWKELSTSGALCREMGDTFARSRSWEEWITAPRMARWATRALRQPGIERRAVIDQGRDELRFALALKRELAILDRGRRIDGSTFETWCEPVAARRSMRRAPAQRPIRPSQPEASDVEDDLQASNGHVPSNTRRATPRRKERTSA